VQCMSGTRLIFELLHVFYWLAIAIGLGLEARKQRMTQLAEERASPHWNTTGGGLRVAR